MTYRTQTINGVKYIQHKFLCFWVGKRAICKYYRVREFEQRPGKLDSIPICINEYFDGEMDDKCSGWDTDCKYYMAKVEK